MYESIHYSFTRILCMHSAYHIWVDEPRQSNDNNRIRNMFFFFFAQLHTCLLILFCSINQKLLVSIYWLLVWYSFYLVFFLFFKCCANQKSLKKKTHQNQNINGIEANKTWRIHKIVNCFAVNSRMYLSR